MISESFWVWSACWPSWRAGGAHPVVSYRSKAGEFEYSEPARNSFDFPAAERFGAQLELLARRASVNRQVNAA